MVNNETRRPNLMLDKDSQSLADELMDAMNEFILNRFPNGIGYGPYDA